MKKKTKIVLHIILVIFLLITLIVLIKNVKTTTNDIKVTVGNLDKVIENIIYNGLDSLTYEEKKHIKEYVHSTIYESVDKEILAKNYFVIGQIYLDELDDENAQKSFEKAISYFDKSINPTIKIRTYYELSRIFLEKDMLNESEDMFKQVRDICYEENLKIDLVELSMKRERLLLDTNGGVSKAIKLMEDTLEVAKEINYSHMEEVYLRLGIAYWYDDRNSDAIFNKLEALQIAESKKLDKKVATIMVDIGVDFLFTGRYDDAITYLKQSLDYNLEDSYEDAEVKSYALLNLCEAYIYLEDYENAEWYLTRLEESLKKEINGVDREDSTTYMYVTRADLNTRLGFAYESIRLLDMAVERYNSREDFIYYDFDIRLAEEYGDAYYELGKYDRALKYHKYVEELTEYRGSNYYRDSNTYSLYLDYKAMGDYTKAMEYLEKNNEIKLESNKNKEMQYAQYLLKKFESEKSREKIDYLEYIKRIMTSALIALVIIIVIVGYFTTYIYKKNKEINRLNKLFKYLSMTDPLTKVPNRRALDEYLGENWSIYEKTLMPVSFVMIDIDYFKNYNDNYGHPEGDKVLQAVANTIRESCRSTDFVARYGGEEFTIIMLNSDKDGTINVLERVQKNIYDLNIKHEVSEVSDRVTLSIGITINNIGENKDYRSYITTADKALYEAKKKGRNTYVYLE